MRQARTFNNRGQLLLGDAELPAGTTAAMADLDQTADPSTGIIDPTAPVGSVANPLQLPAMTVSVAPGSFSLAQLLQPPGLYWLIAGVALFAYLNKNGAR